MRAVFARAVRKHIVAYGFDIVTLIAEFVVRRNRRCLFNLVVIAYYYIFSRAKIDGVGSYDPESCRSRGVKMFGNKLCGCSEFCRRDYFVLRNAVFYQVADGLVVVYVNVVEHPLDIMRFHIRSGRYRIRNFIGVASAATAKRGKRKHAREHRRYDFILFHLLALRYLTLTRHFATAAFPSLSTA